MSPGVSLALRGRTPILVGRKTLERPGGHSVVKPLWGHGGGSNKRHTQVDQGVIPGGGNMRQNEPSFLS